MERIGGCVSRGFAVDRFRQVNPLEMNRKDKLGSSQKTEGRQARSEESFGGLSRISPFWQSFLLIKKE
jgi:hypothetical protein